LDVVEVDVQGIVALGNGKTIQVESGVGVQNSRVIGAQAPYPAKRLECAVAAENPATPDRGGMVEVCSILPEPVLIVSQRAEGIEFHRPPRRNVAGSKRDGGEQNDYPGKGQRVARTHAV
jgi:hypothetical protein